MNINFPYSIIDHPCKVLAADIGATKTNIALLNWDGYGFEPSFKQTVKSKSFVSIENVLVSFLKGKEKPDIISLAVAGPVQKGRSLLTNLDLNICASDVSDFFHLPVLLINDLQAAAFGLSILDDTEVHPLHQVCVPVAGNIALIAPGTGLGEGGLFYDGEYYYPFATEGGHCSFAGRTDLDFELHNYLAHKYGHVSWERVLSGPGIVDIYNFLSHEKDREEPAWLKEKFLVHDKATVIGENATECSICKEVIEMFIRFLAFESANLVLKIKATAGLFISGGIIPNLLPMLDEGFFMKHFTSFGRMKSLLETIPVRVIINKELPLLGAAYYALIDNSRKKFSSESDSFRSKPFISHDLNKAI